MIKLTESLSNEYSIARNAGIHKIPYVNVAIRTDIHHNINVLFLIKNQSDQYANSTQKGINISQDSQMYQGNVFLMSKPLHKSIILQRKI
jgi:hypothetical protein